MADAADIWKELQGALTTEVPNTTVNLQAGKRRLDQAKYQGRRLAAGEDAAVTWASNNHQPLVPPITPFRAEGATGALRVC